MIKLSEILTVKSVIYGINIHILGNNEYEIHYLKISKKAGKIEIEEISDIYNDLKSLISKIPNYSAVCLSLSGKNIISKKQIVESSDELQNLLNKVLPNASSKDFYIQVDSSDDTKSYISVIRKQNLFEIINKFTEKKILIIELTIGPFSINSITKFLSLNELNIKLNDHFISIKQNVISTILKDISKDSKIQEHFKIGDKILDSKNILSFASVFNYFFPVNDRVIELGIVESSKKEYRFKNLFKLSGYIAIIVFMILLLVNFLLFDNYSKKLNTVETQYRQSISLFQLSDSLTRSISNKEKFIADNNILSKTEFSYYADRLAVNMPHSILLNELNINPQQKRIKKDSEILFDKKQVKITGIVQNSTDMGEWINILKKETWIKDVKVIDYKFDDKKQKGVFEINVIIN